MRKIGFHQRNSTGKVGTLPEYEEHPDLHFGTEMLLAAMPQLQQNLDADLVPQVEFPQTLTTRLRQTGSHPSFVDSNSISPGNQKAVSLDDQAPDFLGLELICDHTELDGDIIFVHGLGGTFMRTWNWKREISHFWRVWLNGEQL
jgi:hypothetical protein